MVTQKVQRREEYYKDPQRCPNCQSVIPYERKRNQFCNHSCAATFNNKGVRKHGNPQEVPCALCGKMTRNVKYCSHECSALGRVRTSNALIEEAGRIDNVETGKRYLIQTRGHQCEKCHITEWLGVPVPLILDHIDGHSENNDLTNLQLVCSNCDALLPTYNGRNAGNGRYSRRKRYAEGKSY